MKKLGALANILQAVAPLTSSGPFLTAAQKIDGNGYSRAMFVFNLGVPLAGASFNASIWDATTSGATFAVMTDAKLAQMTSGATSCVAVIDVEIVSSRPWLFVSGSGVGNSNWPAGAVCFLYYAANRVAAPTGVQQIVTV
jgi:hypothetical protein